jgi:hypothetical protein
MKPQQKAKQLIDKFTVVGLQQRNEGIQCALIAVDEIIESAQFLHYGIVYINIRDYWAEVKQEIEKL